MSFSRDDYRLRVTPPDGPAFERPLLEGDLVIGRSVASDLAVSDPFLSRRHLKVSRNGEEVEIEDLGSSNGTRLNGGLVEGPTALEAGDILQLCGTTVELKIGPPTSALPDGGLSTLAGDQSLFLSASEVLAAQSRELGPDRGERAVRQVAERLSLLNEVHEALSSSMSEGQLLELILDRAFGHLEPEEGAVYLGRDDGFELAAVRRLPGSDRPYLYSRSLIAEVIEKGLAALVLDIETDQRFSAVESLVDAGVRSLIAAPLLTPQGSLGMIVLNSRVAEKRFTQADLELLISLASVAAMRLRNIALAEEAAERRRLEEEVRLARQVQVALVPRELPQPEGWDVYAGTVPSRGVSGDFYLAVERAVGELFLMVADVSGKGMGAALLMASLEALCAPAIAKGLPAEDVFDEVSPLLFQRTPAAKYATAFSATLDAASGRLRWANAGHNPGIVVRVDGSLEELGATGMPLGLVDENAFEGRDLELQDGDLLMVYSDGLVEAESPDGEEHGLDRLIDLCREHASSTLGEIARGVERGLNEFTGGQPESDDRTLLLLRRTPAGD